MHFSTFLIVEFLALLTAIYYWRETRHTKLHYLVFFLMFICCIEIISLILINNNMRAETKWVYIISVPVEFSFYLFLIYLHGESFSKKASCIFLVFFNLANIVGLLAQSAYKGSNISILLGDICVALAVCFYLVNLFNKETDVPLFHNYFFWIASVLLLFCLGEMGYFFLIPYIKANKLDEFGKMFKLINNNLMVVLYGSYIIALIMHHRQLKKNAA